MEYIFTSTTDTHWSLVIAHAETRDKALQDIQQVKNGNKKENVCVLSVLRDLEKEHQEKIQKEQWQIFLEKTHQLHCYPANDKSRWISQELADKRNGDLNSHK